MFIFIYHSKRNAVSSTEAANPGCQNVPGSAQHNTSNIANLSKRNAVGSTETANPGCQNVAVSAQHNTSNALCSTPYWLKTFKKRGVYIKEATHGTNKHIYHNI